MKLYRVGDLQEALRTDTSGVAEVPGVAAKRAGGGDTPQERARQLVEKLGLARGTR
jgi:hypothetical protein